MQLSVLLLFVYFEGYNCAGGFREVALRVHNDMRKRFNLTTLQLDSGLNVVAQRHATTLAESQKFYASGGGYGKKENLWAFYGDLRTLADDVSQATHDWFLGVSESSNLLRVNPKNTILAKETTIIGIGAETNAKGYSVVVANYL